MTYRLSFASLLACFFLYSSLNAEIQMPCFSEDEMHFAAQFDNWTVAAVTPNVVRTAGTGRGQSVYLEGHVLVSEPIHLSGSIKINTPGVFPTLQTGETFLLLLAAFDPEQDALWRIAGVQNVQEKDLLDEVQTCKDTIYATLNR
jgi:hypothetical protein